MSDFVTVRVQRRVFEKLRKLAILTGNVNAVIERLISHWESSATATQARTERAAIEVQLWHSPSGDVLPVGGVLQGNHYGKPHRATVESDGIRFKGILYDSPSAAARAVKHARGLRGPSAQTNGRDFWKLRDPKTNRWVPISALRPAYRVD